MSVPAFSTSRPPLDAISSSDVIQTDKNPAVSSLYVELYNEASKYVSIVSICARRDRGVDAGGGGCSASQTPCQWRQSGDAFTADHRKHWKSPCKRHNLAFSYLEASGSATHAERNCCSRSRSILPIRMVMSIRTKQSTMHLISPQRNAPE